MFSFGSFTFHPRLAPSLMALLGCGLFFGLAAWQTDRAFQKRELQAEIEQRRKQAPIQWPDQDLGDQAYRAVRARGSMLLDREVLLDNKVHRGQAGYHVITPFQAVNGKTLLLNRGWVPLGKDRQRPPVTPGPGEPVTLDGSLYRAAGRPLGLSQAGAKAVRTDRVWPYLDRDWMRERLDSELPALEVRLAPDSPYGFVRDWPRADTKVGMHVAYAIQWLAFALIAAATYLYVSVSRRTEGQ